MSQSNPPTFINIDPPGSNPDTPSEIPGTPTSTTTSLSAVSTTAIKDGHRGHFPKGPLDTRGHQHNPSTSSLEAERADRISRLAGLERVSTLRAPPHTPGSIGGGAAASSSPQTTPTSTAGFPPGYPQSQHLTPAYFDSNGQPVAVTKMSTVGSASATESHVGEDGRTTAGDRDEDIYSNYREGGSVVSAGADPDAMEEDRISQGGYEDRMSDDGSASLVGFGEGAGSTVSGPIYQRRPLPNQQPGMLDRSNSGMSDVRRDRDTPMAGNETPITAAATQERREARVIDGIAADQHQGAGDGANFVDTTMRGPLPQGREAAEDIVQRLDHGESQAGEQALGTPGRGGEALGKFYFEGNKK